MTITITLSKSELLSRLISVSKIISSKPTLPIMENVLLDIQDGKVNISAADYQGRINTSIDGILTDGNISICIEPKILIEALKILPEQPLTISINEENFNTTIKYKGGKFELVGKSAKDFPKEKDIKDAVKLSISTNVLLNGIEKTYFCAANDELRPIMNGVYFDITEGQLNFVASDGCKLALLEHSGDSFTAVNTVGFVLPLKIATILRGMIKPSDELTDIFVGNNTVRFEHRADSIIATLIEGRYPNYRSVMPQNNDKILTVGVSDLKGAIKRVSVFSNQSSSLIKLQLTNDQVKVSAQDIDYSLAADETVACGYTNSDIAIGFKGSFLGELISAIPSESLQMSFSDPMRATLITPVDNENSDKLTYLLMPMVLND